MTNSLEEGLMTQVGNPSHADPARVAVSVGCVLGLLAFVVMYLAGWAVFLAAILSFLVAAGVAVAIFVVVQRRMQRRRNALQDETRRLQAKAADAAIQSARASGQFDRWENGSA